VKQADWLVRWHAKTNGVVLVPGAGWSAGRDPAGAQALDAGRADNELGDRLKKKLTAVARAENLKKLAAGAETPRGDQGIQVKVEPRRRDGVGDSQGAFPIPWPTPDLTLYDGDYMAFKITNTGRVT